MTELPKCFKVVDTQHGLCLTTDDEKWGYDGTPYLWTMEEAALAAKELVDKFSPSVKIPIKKYEMDESLSWEDRYKKLEKHHEKETQWLISQLAQLHEMTGAEDIVAQIDEMIGHALRRPGMYAPEPLAWDLFVDHHLWFRGLVLGKTVNLRKVEVELCRERFKDGPGAVSAYSVMLDRFGECFPYPDHEKYTEYMSFYEELIRRVREQQDT